jgi:acyl-coenzyme A thioesterase PaaI-like protein
MQSVAGKTYGTVSADRQREMSGLEFVRGLVEGTLPLNTIAETLGYDIIEAENGRVIVVAEPKHSHLNPAGTVHGGRAATMLDSCMGLQSIRPWKRVWAPRRLSSRYHSSGRLRRRQV